MKVTVKGVVLSSIAVAFGLVINYFRNDSWDRLMYGKETLATHQSKLWNGACELFHYIQRLRDLEDNIEHIESEKQAFAQIRYAYQDRYRRS